ncbi:unnamed protein product [Brachionus calyciflorus]|uniref:TLDc domain-containing protein n=1 Tax=Brachionus calyciflorus TaxID=104777 RepID=A0A814FQ74_9BILA|nr:unnamed protein product [Brachionus calyciflorus]
MSESLPDLLKSFDSNLKFVTESFDETKSLFNQCDQKYTHLNNDLYNLQSTVKLIIDKAKQDKIISNPLEENVTKLNIGGRIFSTLKSTLTKELKDKDSKPYPPHMFHLIFNGSKKFDIDEHNNAIFIDRDPKYFSHVLDYLRYGDSGFVIPEDIDLKKLYLEGKFYQIKGLEDMFLVSHLNSLDSKILSQIEVKKFYDLCNIRKDARWKLLYRASVDGFYGETFHSKCDGIGGTLTFIKTTYGYIFGGYTTQLWDNRGHSSKKDDNAFVFSLKNYLKTPKNMNSLKTDRSIHCICNLGPSFGECFKLSYKSDTAHSESELDNSYQNDSSPKYLLAGQKKFLCEEIEVFQIF